MKSYWVICVQSYSYEGIDIPKGRMMSYSSERPIVSQKWRLATVEEIESKQSHKGNYFNLKNV